MRCFFYISQGRLAIAVNKHLQNLRGLKSEKCTYISLSRAVRGTSACVPLQALPEEPSHLSIVCFCGTENITSVMACIPFV